MACKRSSYLWIVRYDPRDVHCLCMHQRNYSGWSIHLFATYLWIDSLVCYVVVTCYATWVVFKMCGKVHLTCTLFHENCKRIIKRTALCMNWMLQDQVSGLLILYIWDFCATSSSIFSRQFSCRLYDRQRKKMQWAWKWPRSWNSNTYTYTATLMNNLLSITYDIIARSVIIDTLTKRTGSSCDSGPGSSEF